MGARRGAVEPECGEPRSADDDGRAAHQQQVRHDASGEAALDQVDVPARQRRDAEDQLRCIAEGDVEETAERRSYPLRQLLGRIADALRQRHQGQRGEDEELHRCLV